MTMMMMISRRGEERKPMKERQAGSSEAHDNWVCVWVGVGYPPGHAIKQASSGVSPILSPVLATSPDGVMVDGRASNPLEMNELHPRRQTVSCS